MKKFWIIKILFRGFVGIGIILMVNKLINDSNYLVSVKPDVFSFLISGFLGIPGVLALYGIAVYLFL